MLAKERSSMPDTAGRVGEIDRGLHHWGRMRKARKIKRGQDLLWVVLMKPVADFFPLLISVVYVKPTLALSA